ncbi:MAG: tetratricopeptide repeat protein [Coriobacteriales bacterium]|jgi:tetratricopeptide (TPR) repeat protein|nr:tetratricopeptide repeat protein [Coriobacteriales bacterium]
MPLTDSSTEIKELNEQGRVLFSADNYPEAIKMYGKALKIDPESIPTLLNRIEAEIMFDSYEEARSDAARILEIDPGSGEAHFHLGNIALLESEYELGRKEYAAAFNEGYDDAQMYMNLASVSEERGEFDEAVSYYAKALVRDEFATLARVRMVELYMLVHDLDAALKAADALIAIQPEVFEGHHYKVIILMQMDKNDEAAEALDFALQMFPDDQGFIFDRVRILEANKKFQEALDLLNLKIDTAPDAVMALERGRLLIALQKVSDAKKILHDQNATEPDADIMVLLMAIAVDDKDFDEVLRYASEIIDLHAAATDSDDNTADSDTNYFAALYFKAFALKNLGEIAEAKLAYEVAAREMQLECSLNAGLLDLYVYRAACYLELDNFDKAQAMVDYVLNLDDSIAEIYRIRAAIFEKRGQKDKAKADLKTAEQKNSLIGGILG